MRVKIKQSDIRMGKRYQGKNCAIARGLKRATGAKYVIVGRERVHVHGQTFDLPDNAYLFRENFDKGVPDLEPIEFDLPGFVPPRPDCNPNARFWVFWNGGPVKITLKPGQSLSVSQGRTHEEGWSSESETWEHEGDGVRSSWENDGRDCDGRLTQRGSAFCPLDKLDDVVPYWLSAEDATAADRETWADVLYPDWQDAERSQYDEYAELAGY